MKDHINNLIERLYNYSEKLDKIALFTDKKWVFVDEANNQQSYIFKRDGKFIMSLNGKVNIGAWEYLPEARSILIDRIQDKILLNHAFFDEALMILKYDGAPNKDFFILVDEKKIPDLNILKHLESKVVTNEINIVKTTEKDKIQISLNNDDILTIFTNYFTNYGFIIGFNLYDSGFIKDQMPKDGVYVSKCGKYSINFINGLIEDYVITHIYKLSNGTNLIVKSKQFHMPKEGDLAFDYKGIEASSGKYRIGFLDHLTVNDGRFVKFSYW